MVEFLEISDLESKDFNAAMDIYADAFPLNERKPINVIKEKIKKGLNQIYIGRVGKDIVFVALLWPLRNTDFILLDYMATKAKYRGKNIGSDFLKKMHSVLKENKKYFILEVEHPEYGDNRKQRQNRLDFYKRNGTKLLKDVRYILPPLQGSTPTEMVLMIFPNYNEGKIEAILVQNLIIQIYKEVYNQEAKESLLSLSFYDHKSQIELI